MHHLLALQTLGLLGLRLRYWVIIVIVIIVIIALASYVRSRQV